MEIYALLLVAGNLIVGAAPGFAADSENLFDIIAAQDTAVFDAFNSCASSEQFGKHKSFFSTNVEFYHDTGGVTWNRDDMLANTKKHVCGKFKRELIPGSLKVFPIAGYGAISQGSHRFCQFTSGSCEGLADFTMIWHEHDGMWQITRVLSYGHRAAAEEDK